MKFSVEKKRNIAIIAHVDHGKTTLADKLMKKCEVDKQRAESVERLLDSNDQEKERGITILSKITTLFWEGYKIGMVDTPGHADFGGEVERVLDMVDGVLLLVDSYEGPMPQTKFVLSKALKQNLKVIVVINKIDKPENRAKDVIDEIFELFMSLDASEDQLDFPVIYASAKNGWAVNSLDDIKDENKNMSPILKTIVDKIPFPKCNPEKPFQMLASNLDYNPYVGRIVIGKIYSGEAKVGMPVHSLDIDGNIVESGKKLTKIFYTKGIKPIELEKADAGDIISVAGLSETTVSNTISSTDIKEALPALPIDPPTISMSFSVNDSPFCGQSGKKLTSRMIYDRLLKEASTNVSIKVVPSSDSDSYEVSGRGELQLGVLIESMRREGFELSIGRPKVIFKEDESGKKLEPIEEVIVDVDDEFSGIVIEKISLRKGELLNMDSMPGNKTRIIFLCPSRGLIGYRNEFLTDTRGTGLLNKSFHSYAPYKGTIQGRKNGVLIANGNGQATAYDLEDLQIRGVLFIDAGTQVYEGLIIGQHNKDNDLDVNVTKGKKLTNMRSKSSDGTVQLAPPKKMTLEDAISYIQEDEIIEVTPDAIRLRKLYLSPNDRKRFSKKIK